MMIFPAYWAADFALAAQPPYRPTYSAASTISLPLLLAARYSRRRRLRRAVLAFQQDAAAPQYWRLRASISLLRTIGRPLIGQRDGLRLARAGASRTTASPRCADGTPAHIETGLMGDGQACAPKPAADGFVSTLLTLRHADASEPPARAFCRC